MRTFRRPQRRFVPQKKQLHRINDQIHVPEVRLIDENGKQVGVVSFADAIQTAQSHGYDLVEIVPDAKPPICKLLDYGQYKYEIEKQEKKHKKKQKKIEVKGVRISPRISENDLDFKVQQAERFFAEGNKVRLEMVIRGREFAHRDLIKETFDRFLKRLTTKVLIEQAPKRQRLGLAMVLSADK